MDLNGTFIAINKPLKMTSHDVIDRVRRITGIRKVGHAGTLDPLATGVLVVGIGRQATKQLLDICDTSKEYIADIKLGYYSQTDDEEGEKTQVEVTKIPEMIQILQILEGFTGEIDQVPPAYSAVKIDGKAAYKYARKRQHLDMSIRVRKVRIDEIKLLEYDWPALKIRVVTGPGVYVRTLARDIGTKLNTGGYLTGLVRTRVGKYSIEQSLSLDQLEEQVKSHNSG